MSKKRNKKRNIILRPSVSETDVWQIGGVKVINTIPDSWQYTDDLEMLFLFYQSTDELLSEVTPDTYALPLHNALSLIDEIVETYRLLKHHNSICEYYSKYIPPIIDELLQKIEDDYLLKKYLENVLIALLRDSMKPKTTINIWRDGLMYSISPVVGQNIDCSTKKK